MSGFPKGLSWFSFFSWLGAPDREASPLPDPAPLPRPMEPPAPPVISKEEQFIRALPVVAAEGFNPMSVFVHASHETGRFHTIKGTTNCFGMKVPHAIKYTGKIVLSKSYEGAKSDRLETSSWVDFDTMEEMLAFYCATVKRVHPKAYEVRSSSIAYFYALEQPPAWGEAEHYAAECEQLFKELSNDLALAARIKVAAEA